MISTFLRFQQSEKKALAFTKEEEWAAFIVFAEDEWLQYRDTNDAIRAYFGSKKAAKRAFRWWKREMA